jgi:hypothetical protein
VRGGQEVDESLGEGAAGGGGKGWVRCVRVCSHHYTQGALLQGDVVYFS